MLFEPFVSISEDSFIRKAGRITIAPQFHWPPSAVSPWRLMPIDNEDMSEAVLTANIARELVNESAWCDPAPGLRGLVDAYVGFRQEGVEPARHRGLPSPALTLIFTLDDPLVLVAHPDPAQPPGIYETVVGGLHTSPAIITHEGRQSGIQLGLSPLGARALLGVPASELAELDVPADEILGPLTWQIQDRLRTAAGWPERFAILDEVLLARAAHGRMPGDVGGAMSAEVSYAWRRLVRAGGDVSVRALAAETGWSERHLRARFRAEIGLAPKAAARVIRFDRARRVLQRRAVAGEPLCLADLAPSCGYFDQAHLDREFGLLAGCSPTRWLAEEFRNIQASAA
jgi:AraC-like DNA-binding protein